MPKNYAGDPTKFPANLLLPLDGERANAETFNRNYRPLADRTAWLREQTVGAAGEGVTRIRSVANLAALKAMTDMADGDVVRVGRLGLYTYEASATDSAAEPLIAEPASGAGRWFHASTDVVGVAGGIASLGANGKVPDEQLGRGSANGVASLGANGKVPDAQLGRGEANGVASLTILGAIPTNQLPGVVVLRESVIGGVVLEVLATGAAAMQLKGGPGDQVTSTPAGYGVGAEAGDPNGEGQRAALRVVPQEEPITGSRGDVYVDETNGRMHVHDGTAWRPMPMVRTVVSENADHENVPGVEGDLLVSAKADRSLVQVYVYADQAGAGDGPWAPLLPTN